ncbi:hypothetical protein H310_10631 [Aphanomyces invadans]|uniref:Uncharacterized protein n=1 Tax=Aphanomyces invadans TaxID=157072 RepID=A0A024TPB4_9STRA|nr:hypothetical protein H310_10631 [Aphanomyces invadans]ETV95975.1 hypothetical protein H310_10631 [Aphanomyces invadans]|eukprot:XP_008875286.1 hypothetical protein H310_10631 [Aphanomyces invadans]
MKVPPLVTALGGAVTTLLIVSVWLAWQLHQLNVRLADTAVHRHVNLAVVPPPTPSAPSTPPPIELPDWRQAFDRSDYTCVGWYETGNCDADTAPIDPLPIHDCHVTIPTGSPGFCAIQHRETGVIRRLYTRCDGVRAPFQCIQTSNIWDYAVDTKTFVYTHAPSVPAQNLRGWNTKRGIVMSLYPNALATGYAAIRQLRAVGCALPIEIWIVQEEMLATDAILHALVESVRHQYNCMVRYVEDPLARRFYVKPYAIYHSLFDQVLFLDADNFAVRDPSYLFSRPEFVQTGAMFWPDFWQPNNTIFGVTDRSLLWEILGIPFVDMFEQESGQLVIDRRKSRKPLAVLMRLAFGLPRLLHDMDLIWGDKDLFRLAWLQANHPFHMIEKPPGAAGLKHRDFDLFCGHTMVQHDPDGQILFLHRNTFKLTGAAHVPLLWSHIQDFRRSKADVDYVVRFAHGGEAFEDFRCFGNDTNYSPAFEVRPFAEYPFASIEVHHGVELDVVTDAVVSAIVKAASYDDVLDHLVAAVGEVDAKAILVAIKWILVHAAKYNVQEGVLLSEVQQLGLPSDAARTLTSVFHLHQHSLRRHLQLHNTLATSTAVPCKWQLSYAITSAAPPIPTIEMSLGGSSATTSFDVDVRTFRALHYELRAAQALLAASVSNVA